MVFAGGLKAAGHSCLPITKVTKVTVLPRYRRYGEGNKDNRGNRVLRTCYPCYHPPDGPPGEIVDDADQRRLGFSKVLHCAPEGGFADGFFLWVIGRHHVIEDSAPSSDRDAANESRDVVAGRRFGAKLVDGFDERRQGRLSAAWQRLCLWALGRPSRRVARLEDA